MAPYNQNRQTYTFPQIDATQLKKIITETTSTEILVQLAENIGKALASPAHGKELSTNQIRALFSEVRQIEGKWKIPQQEELAKRQLILLKPKMAYRAKKEGKGVVDLVAVLDPAIDLVQSDKENFIRFVDFFEAILAYHRAAGGK